MHQIKPGGHYYQFYKTLDDYEQMSLSYLYAGLKKGNACLWLVDDKLGVEKAEKEFLGVYPDAAGYIIVHQLQINSAQTWYLRDGRFDMDQALTNAQIFLDDCFLREFACVRGMGDLGIIPDEDWELLHQYEHKIQSMIEGIPFIAVCAYPIHRCSVSDTKKVIEVHHQPLFISMAS